MRYVQLSKPALCPFTYRVFLPIISPIMLPIAWLRRNFVFVPLFTFGYLLGVPISANAHKMLNPASELHAQSLADDLVATNPKMVDAIFHVEADSTLDSKLKLKKQNVVIAAHLREAVGEDSSEDALAVIKTGRPFVKIQKDKLHIEVLLPLKDAQKKTIGAVGLMYRYKAGEAEKDFLKDAEQTRDQLTKLIPNHVSLFKSIEVPLVSGRKIEVPGNPGKFDFMTFDPERGRVLAAHKEAKTLEILDSEKGELIKSIEVGEAQGVSVDPAMPRYFVGDAGEKRVVIVDATTFAIQATVPVDGEVDALVYDSKNKMIYAAQDDGDHIWVIDPASAKVITTIKIPGVPEVIEYDGATDRVYVNIKDKDLLIKINPISNSIDATWSTRPVQAPHGLVIDSKRGLAYVAGRNGKIVAIDLASGKVKSTSEVAMNVDQIAFDPGPSRILSSGKGAITATLSENKQFKSEGGVAAPAGAHTIAIDPVSHAAWISYSTLKQSYLQEFVVTSSKLNGAKSAHSH